MKYIRVFILISIIFAALFSLTLFKKSEILLTQSTKSMTILMKKEGFEPAEVRIKKATTVKFINQDSQERWPASNLHPTHGIYPAFDPKMPIKSGAEWSFVFNNIGTWKYHDHLTPSLRGVIVVTD